MMTTSFIGSHITLGVGPDSQNKHTVKSPPVLALTWHLLMVPACLGPDQGTHGSAVKKTKHPAWWRSPVESVGICSLKAAPASPHYGVAIAKACLGWWRLMVLINASITEEGRRKRSSLGKQPRTTGAVRTHHRWKAKWERFYCASISFENNNHSPLSSSELYHKHRFGEGPCFINSQMSSAIDGIGRPWVQLG